jgi:hypothetical protein
MKVLTAWVIAAGLTLAVPGCGKSAGSTVPVDGKEVTLQPGETVRLAGSQSTLQFLAVPEDSRCPEGVQCIWAGNARLSLKLDDTPFAINTTVEPREAVVAGFRFQLVQLTQPPRGDTVPGHYSATLKVTR